MLPDVTVMSPQDTGIWPLRRCFRPLSPGTVLNALRYVRSAISEALSAIAFSRKVICTLLYLRGQLNTGRFIKLMSGVVPYGVYHSITMHSGFQRF
jgi:hypothetical protein